MTEPTLREQVIVNLAKKLPATVAIVALGWALIVSITHSIDSAFRLTLVAAIAGLGGFYLRDLLDRKAPL